MFRFESFGFLWLAHHPDGCGLFPGVRTATWAAVFIARECIFWLESQLTSSNTVYFLTCNTAAIVHTCCAHAHPGCVQYFIALLPQKRAFGEGEALKPHRMLVCGPKSPLNFSLRRRWGKFILNFAIRENVLPLQKNPALQNPDLWWLFRVS